MSQKIAAVSGYAAAKLVNAALVEAGSDFQIKPQMVYNYMKNGLFNVADGKVLLDERFASWLARYIDKKAPKAEEIDEDEFVSAS